MTSVTIDNSVESIGDYAFSYYKGLASVIIGNSVESIGGFAFDGCSKLLEVYCYAEKVPTASSYPYPHYIFAYAFDTSFIKNSILRVPAASIDSYKASEPRKHFGQIPLLYLRFPLRYDDLAILDVVAVFLVFFHDSIV